jgi:putative ABC transport system permease protein
MNENAPRHVGIGVSFGRFARLIGTARRDLEFAIRGLSRSPGLTLTVILSLSLGVGANVAVFTAIDRVFLQAPRGVVKPDQMRRLYARIFSVRGPDYGPTGRVVQNLSTRDLQALGEVTRGTARLAGDHLGYAGRLNGVSRRTAMTYVSPGYFDLLGVRPVLGRFFAPDEDRITGAPMPVVVMSHAFWRSQFGGDSAIVGRSIQLDDDSYTVIGIAAREFEGIELEVTDLWLPLTNIAGGNITFLKVIARLESGATDVKLNQLLATGFRRARQNDPDVADSSLAFAASFFSARGPGLVGVFGTLASGAPFAGSRIRGMPERSIALLPRLGLLSGVVLIIATANVASLLLMRALRRRREIGTRVALGAPIGRLMAQLISESLLLALIAGAVALAVANATGGVLRAQLSTLRWTDTVVDHRAVLLGLSVAIIAGLAAGLAPAIFALRMDVVSSLRSSSGITMAASGVRTGLLVAQAALCTALLASGGTFLQSLRRATAFDYGFDHDRLIQVAIPARDANAETELASAAARLRATPGVLAVGRTLTPLGALGMTSKVGPDASDTIGVGLRGPSLEFVDPEFMRAAGFRAIAGRLLTPADNFAPVTILTESLARALFPAGDVLGRCVHVREPSGPCREIVGVVRDLHWFLATPSFYRAFVPLPQAWTTPPRALIPNYLYVRLSDASRPADVARLRSTLTTVLSHPEELSVQRLTAQLAPQLRPWRVAAILFLVLGSLGLLAAATGMYGLVAYDVTQRSREIGVRIALGATGTRIVRLVVGSGVRVVLMGVGAGLLAAFGIGRVMLDILFGTTPFDPLVVAVTVLVLVLAAILASLVPVWRALRVNPAIALTSE